MLYRYLYYFIFPAAPKGRSYYSPNYWAEETSMERLMNLQRNWGMHSLKGEARGWTDVVWFKKTRPLKIDILCQWVWHQNDVDDDTKSSFAFWTPILSWMPKGSFQKLHDVMTLGSLGCYWDVLCFKTFSIWISDTVDTHRQNSHNQAPPCLQMGPAGSFKESWDQQAWELLQYYLPVGFRGGHPVALWDQIYYH